MSRPRLLFVSPRFLFPIDSGGKIRTTGILREMLGGAFDITLLSPAPDAPGAFDDEMATVCDRWHYWPQGSDWRRTVKRLMSLATSLPIPVASDKSAAARRLIARELARDIDVAVFDFAHAAVLSPEQFDVPSVMFTHNVEAEIFARHIGVANDPLRRWLWRSQWRKMVDFEATSLRRFDRVIAVSDRDKQQFVRAYGLGNVDTIPTGVDLSFFPYRHEPEPGRMVFTGSMDWLANQDGIEYFFANVWPKITSSVPHASMRVVGRAPPERMRAQTTALGEAWEFTGFVDDVRPYIHRASAYVIPLRVGGGTRLKVFEAMASGSPVVSTAIGVEGLGLIDGVHYLKATTPDEFATATIRLLTDKALGQRLSLAARRHVVEFASNAIVARRFEEICSAALSACRMRNELAATDRLPGAG